MPCKDQGKLDEAVACYRRALELKPDYAEAHNNLGNALKDQGKLDEAIACYRRALELKPDYAEAHNNLGNAFKDQGKLDEAVACYRRALELKPDYAEAHNNLGDALTGAGEAGRSGRLLPPGPGTEAGLCRGPQQPGRCLGRTRGSWTRRSPATAGRCELKPDYAEAHSNLALYAPVSRRRHARRSWPRPTPSTSGGMPRRCASDLAAARERPRSASGGLRLGFVSPDFGRHPVGYFLVRVLENLDQRAVRGRLLLRPDRPRRADGPLPGAAATIGATWSAGPTSGWPSRSAPTGSTSSSTWPATRPETGCWSSPASRRRSRSPGSATWARPAWRRWTTSWPTVM